MRNDDRIYTLHVHNFSFVMFCLYLSVGKLLLSLLYHLYSSYVFSVSRATYWSWNFCSFLLCKLICTDVLKIQRNGTHVSPTMISIFFCFLFTLVLSFHLHMHVLIVSSQTFLFMWFLFHLCSCIFHNHHPNVLINGLTNLIIIKTHSSVSIIIMHKFIVAYYVGIWSSQNCHIIISSMQYTWYD